MGKKRRRESTSPSSSESSEEEVTSTNSNVNYVKHATKSKDKSSVWYYFLIADRKSGLKKGKCIKCDMVVSNSGGSTGKLWSHLKDKHEIVKSETQSRSDLINLNNQNNLNNFVIKRMSLEERCVRMMVLEDLPFKKMAGESIRGLLLDVYNGVPKSPTTFRSMMIDYAIRRKSVVKAIIGDLISKEIKFCVSFDEWVSVANRRYLGINLHYGDEDVISLGAVRIMGSSNAENILNLVKERLSSFGLVLIDNLILSITTDGCNTMLKVIFKNDLYQLKFKKFYLNLGRRIDNTSSSRIVLCSLLTTLYFGYPIF